MSERDAERLEQAIAELVAHAHDDLPDGPSSDLGGEVRSKLIRTRSEREFEHLAARGKALVESRLAKRKRETA
jgi:hypothetical protein